MSALTKIREDLLGGLDSRYVLGRLLVAPLPGGSAPRIRAELLRLAGLRIGRRTLLMDAFGLHGGSGASSRLSIGNDCFLNVGCRFDATAPITIEDHVSFGHSVLVTTAGHEFGHPRRRAGASLPAAVRVGQGAWLASRVTVLPGVEIGEGAVVAAGAVVTKDVRPHTLVGGVPARELREL